MEPAGLSETSNAGERFRSRPRLAVHPATGLSTDYLNHFNEAIMLLDMLEDCPDCAGDLLNWKPMSYCEHFSQSRHDNRDQVIAAYDRADPDARRALAALADTMTELLQLALTDLRRAASSADAAAIAAATAADLKPLVASAGATINGGNGLDTLAALSPQAAIDRLMAS